MRTNKERWLVTGGAGSRSGKTMCCPAVRGRVTLLYGDIIYYLGFYFMVAVLFARADSNYKRLPVDVWDEERNAL